MSKLYTILLLVLGLLISCSNDDQVRFDVVMPRENVSFIPRPGGAVMHYRLPAESDVQAVNIRYRDALGNSIYRSGSYTCDTLLIVGFNEAVENVPAEITLSNRTYEESDPIQVSFSTLDSGPTTFLKNVEIRPSWDGFMLLYSMKEEVEGMAHVFYLGKNPLTHETDTISVASFLLNKGRDTLLYPLQQISPTNTVFVRVEDFRGYIVGQREWKDVVSYETSLLTLDDFDFEDPNQLSIEDEMAQVGYRYLFDGDTRGQNLPGDAMGTYITEPNAVGKDLFIMDLREARPIAQIKLYCMLCVKRIPSHLSSSSEWALIWRSEYMDKLPCKFVVYGSNDKEDDSSWVELGRFEEDRYLEFSQRWSNRTASSYYPLIDAGNIKNEDPQSVTLNFFANGDAYRYLKVVVNDVFTNINRLDIFNPQKRVTFHEFEVYVQKK